MWQQHKADEIQQASNTSVNTTVLMGSRNTTTLAPSSTRPPPQPH